MKEQGFFLSSFILLKKHYLEFKKHYLDFLHE